MSEIFQTISQTIKQRRTTKIFSGKELPKELVEKLLDLAVWAPNHGLNEPWRFRVCTQSGIQKWEKALPQEIFQPTFEKLKKVGALIYVTTLKDSNSVVEEENDAATCAAIQNILLGATALGLASYWSTGNLMKCAETQRFLEIQNTERFVGAIWLGYGEAPPPKPRTDFQKKTAWVG